MEGERDPRCLIQCFKLVVAFYACFPAAISMFAERVYDVTACYFPLSFVPPPNDPYGIKPEDLSQSLEDALCGHESLLEFVVPFFIDKLSSTVVLAKVRAACCGRACSCCWVDSSIRSPLPPLADSPNLFS